MLDVPQPDGITLREHLAAAKRQGFVPEGIDEPPPQPPELYRVLPIWYQLSGSRNYVDGVPLRIRDTEIVAWSTLRDEPISPIEVKLLDVIETTWLDVMRTKGAPKT